MLWLGGLLAAVFTVAAILAVIHRAWLRRHLRHPVRAAVVILLVSVVMIPMSVSVATATDSAALYWSQYVVGGEILVLGGLLAFLLGLRRHGAPPRRARRVLVIGAHPDDLELACGGSLASFADAGHEVIAIVMSRGGRGGDGATREHEALAGARTLELAAISVQEFTDTHMAGEIDEMVGVIEQAVATFRPDVILTHSQHDQHQDHYAVHLATMRAARRSSTILCYESPSVTTDFSPSFFVDISDYVDAKIAAVGKHRDQAGKPYMGPRVLRGASVFRGGQARVENAEGFEVMRALSSNLGDL